MISYLKKFIEEVILTLLPIHFYFNFVSRFYLDMCGPRSSNQGLFLWEEEAIKKFFPLPPARILVGGAGAGRELVVLASRGYFLSGFEPIPISAEHAKLIVPKDKLLAFSKATYEDLVSSSLKEIEIHAPYDGAILGWGSITHILDPNMQKLILQKVREFCPGGPILISWFKPSFPHYISTKIKALRKIFSLLKLKTYSDKDYFSFKMGFCHIFTRDEIIALVKASENLIAFYEDEKTYPHAVLIPNKGRVIN